MKIVNGAIVSEPGEQIPDSEPTVNDEPTGSRVDGEGYPTCAACGETNYEFVPGTRGRKPRYHADCKPIAPSANATRVRAKAGLRNEAALRDALTSRYMQLANVASLAHPAYGMGIKQNIAEAVEADIEYARANPKFRAILESGLEKTALGAVIAVHLAMLRPAAVGMYAQSKRKKAQTQPGSNRPAQSPPAPTPHSSASVRPRATVVPDDDSNVTRLFVPDAGMPDEGISDLDKPSNAALLDDGMPG